MLTTAQRAAGVRTSRRHSAAGGAGCSWGLGWLAARRASSWASWRSCGRTCRSSRLPCSSAGRQRLSGRALGDCVRAPTAIVLSASSSPVPARTAAIVRELLCVSARAPSSSRPTALESGRPADRACYRRCHAPIKSRRTSPTGDARYDNRKSGHRPTAAKRVGSPPVGTFSTASDGTDTRRETASLQAAAGGVWSDSEPHCR
jgi:hypothetical protein